VLVYWAAFNLKLRKKECYSRHIPSKIQKKTAKNFETGAPRIQVSSVAVVLTYSVGGNGNEHIQFKHLASMDIATVCSN